MGIVLIAIKDTIRLLIVDHLLTKTEALVNLTEQALKAGTHHINTIQVLMLSHHENSNTRTGTRPLNKSHFNNNKQVRGRAQAKPINHVRCVESDNDMFYEQSEYNTVEQTDQLN